MWEFIKCTVQTLNTQLSQRFTDHQRVLDTLNNLFCYINALRFTFLFKYNIFFIENSAFHVEICIFCYFRWVWMFQENPVAFPINLLPVYLWWWWTCIIINYQLYYFLHLIILINLPHCTINQPWFKHERQVLGSLYHSHSYLFVKIKLAQIVWVMQFSNR